MLDNLPATHLRGVGPRLLERLARLDIRSVQDLLFHLPLRYQDRTRITPIGALRPGAEAVIEGEVQLTQVRYARKRTLLSQLHDGTGAITLRFFHFNTTQQAMLARGARVRCFGEVRFGKAGPEMVHPEYRLVSADAVTTVEERLTPIYPTTEGLHQISIRTLTQRALELLRKQPDALREWLPEQTLAQLHFPTLREAVEYVHYPPPDAPLELIEQGAHPAQRRLAFEELLAHHLSLRLLRQRVQRNIAPELGARGKLMAALLAELPFDLTRAQQRVIGEIRRDLALATPMLRLAQGDVGSGKTLVAACAALHAIESGHQVALMAPTELLAEQHLANFSRWLTPLKLEVALLTGKIKGKARTAALAHIASGQCALVIGTHALFQEDVSFSRLGLVIIDEQHRFGVHQRLALRTKGLDQGRYPHQLIMTATPIPRTLAMVGYADLDSSVIDELPPGRTPVETVVIADTRRADVVERVHTACRAGRQAYWVCTLIEESDDAQGRASVAGGPLPRIPAPATLGRPARHRMPGATTLQCQAAIDTAAQLTAALPDLRVALIHGRMKVKEKEQAMRKFKQGEIDLLVATTVIEVGVDVPNASLMIVENAERLGLAQLHQLRGRVGRGATASHCVLMYHAPLSRYAKARLAALRATNDGFEIARKDLELRGPGEVLGTRQAGLLQLHIADLARDQHLLPEIEHTAVLLLNSYPAHVPPLIRRWLGQGAQYGEV
ncbi:MAG: ATP-dependent DNA helicase RecG [Gammaproteobacteria bacterium]|nr:ATP-dependent DNA helicase RecG [Gammaproteobacteria bacterium]